MQPPEKTLSVLDSIFLRRLVVQEMNRILSPTQCAQLQRLNELHAKLSVVIAADVVKRGAEICNATA